MKRLKASDWNVHYPHVVVLRNGPYCHTYRFLTYGEAVAFYIEQVNRSGGVVEISLSDQPVGVNHE